MEWFSIDASWCYLTLTQIGYNKNLVSEEDYYERLYILWQFCDPAEKDTIANINLLIAELNEWGNLDLQLNHIYPTDVETYIQKNKSKINKEENKTNSNFHGNDFDQSLHFITALAGKISKWEFHKTDSDFFPSIPHGHAITNPKIKLDAYRGYIYKDNKQYDREKRQFIIDLWNDIKFRNIARETIFYYLRTFPHFQWRVSDPLRLPRQRR
ncbi:MAG TPA: hypothetical protein PLZ68_10620 [Ferruginibacter sp.]|nr:hypothetical protein [Ferruginibacter sp.]